MAVVIGAGTTIVAPALFGSNPAAGVVSVQFGFNPQVERLFQLGSFDPYDSTVTKTRTISLTTYGKKADSTGGTLAQTITPSVTCADADAVHITVNPASCVESLLPFAADYFLNSYSYSKDNFGFGQESWGFTGKPEIPGFGGTIVMLRGIPDGQVATGPGTMAAADMGIIIDETASNDSLGAQIEGESGSVQAGTPGLGNFDISRFVIVTSVGGSIGRGTNADGYTGQGSVTIPVNPIFI